MKPWLPSSLLAFVFATAVFSTPVPAFETSAVGSALLTGDNFDTVTARGPWLVEFYSPYCPHCRHFAPTWDKVSEHVQKETQEGKGPTTGIGMAQVNCATYGDLCSAQKVNGYPHIRIYVDGVKKLDFKGDRSFERIIEFMTPFAPPKEVPPNPEEPTLTVQQARSNNPVNPNGQVLSLNPSNFAATVGSGPTFIKFFAPWCGHCKKLAPLWTQLAQNLQNKLTIAEVNCDMYSSLCTQQGVEAYPMLFFYREGHKLDYTGKRTLEAMEAFSDQMIAPAVQALPASHSVVHLLKEHEVIFLFLHIAPDQNALSAVQTAGNTALTIPPIHIYTSISPELRSQYGADTQGPTIIALKAASGKSGEMEYIPTAHFPVTHNITHSEIHAFLGRNAIPLVTELTSDNFQTIMAARAFDPKPLVVILAAKPSGKAEAAELLSAGEENWRRECKEKGSPPRDVLWTYMDGDKWGSWLKNMYGIKSGKMPTYVVADHSKLLYYNEYESGKRFVNGADGLAKAVSQALEGKLKARHSQNIAQRVAMAVGNYSESVVETFVEHPIWMLLLIIAVVAIFAWFVSDMLASDSSSIPPRPGSGRLRLGEKHNRRLD